MNETQEYYAVRNNSCHSFTIETYNGGETWIVSATGEEFKEAWIAEEVLENMLMDRGYQVFYSIEEAEEYLAELDRDDSPGSDLPQETAEETVILDAAESYMLRRGQALYWDGKDLSTRSRHWSTVELVYHDLHGVGYSEVKDLSDWDRSTALELLRSHVSQEEETSEERIARYRAQLSQPCDETDVEKELLDTVEQLRLSPGERVYYNGTTYSFRKRSWHDVCLASHHEDNYPSRVMDLGQWVRHDALNAIRSLNDRLQSV